MSEVLDSLNASSETPAKSWADEVAEVAATEPAPQPVADEPKAEAPVEDAISDEPAPAHDGGETDRRVPLRALQEERQKRAQYEQMLAQREQELQQMQQWAAQVQQQQMQPQEQFVEPDPETDPIGALKYAKEQQRQLQEYLAYREQAEQQVQYVQQLNQVAYQAATDAQQRLPDYQDAYRYALNSRAQELVALGTPPQAVAQILQREELSLIDTAVRNRRNPAEAIYQFAKARGFQGKASGGQPQTIDPALQQQKAAVAPSASSGGSPSSRGTLSVSDVAGLKGAAFDKAWDKLFGGNKSSIFRD